MLGLMHSTATVSEKQGEDAQGVAAYRVTTHAAAYEELTYRGVRSPDGIDPAATWLVVTLPDDFGTSWSAKPGDTVTIEGRTLVVGSARVVMNPRTNTAHHVEITG